MEDTLPTQFDACATNELALVPSGSLALQRVPFVPSGPQRSNVATLPSATKLSRPPMASGVCESPPRVVLNVSNKYSAGDGGQPRITISGQGLQYLFQGLSDRGITLQSFEESASQQPVGRRLQAGLEHSSVLLPCNRAKACRPTLQITELDNVASGKAEPVQCASPTKHGYVAVDSHLCEVPDSPALEDATVPAGQTMAGASFETNHSTADDCQMYQAKLRDEAVCSGTNLNETSLTTSSDIAAKSPSETVVPEAEKCCDISFSRSRMSQDVPPNNVPINVTLSPSLSPHTGPCSEVTDTSGDDGDCSSVPQSALIQCPLPTLDHPIVTSSDLPPPTSLAEQVIVSVAKGLSGVASLLAKDSAPGPGAVQDGSALTESTVEPPSSSSSSLVLAERETQLVQMDDSDEELELPASTPAVSGGSVIPAPPPLPSSLQAAKRTLPSTGEVGVDVHVMRDRGVDDFNLGDLLSAPPSNGKLVFGEHSSFAVPPADGTCPDLDSPSILTFDPKDANMDPLTLPAATACKRPLYELCKQEAPSPKIFKSSMTAEDVLQDGGCELAVHCKEICRREAAEEDVRLAVEEEMKLEAEEKGVGLMIGEEGKGHEAESDSEGVPIIPPQSGCHEPPAGVDEGDSPFPAALPKEIAQLSTSDNGCGVSDAESDDETDSDADESFTCLPHIQDDKTAFHTVPDQTLANSHEMENSPLYCLCPATKDKGVLFHSASTTTPFENRGHTCTHYIRAFAGSSRVEYDTGRTAFNLSRPRLRVGLSRHARVAPLHRNYKRQQ